MLSSALRRSFLAGIFILFPLAASVLVVYWLFNLMDSWAMPLTQHLFGRHIPGVGLVVTFVVILVTGSLGSNVVGRYVLRLVDTLFMEMPVFRSIYNTTKQVMQVFSPHSQSSFHSVVIVEHPRAGGLCIGFVTRDLEITHQGKKEKRVSVYVPTNHFYFGDILMFKPEEVRTTSLTVQQGIQSIISAGATFPAELDTQPYTKN